MRNFLVWFVFYHTSKHFKKAEGTDTFNSKFSLSKHTENLKIGIILISKILSVC